ncbi:MAG: hypothetical protein J6R85_06550 [Lentisphaeria bacterium]|jgi:hypothetical protein|nr:hypothetical protein [Lentisphaeria bacterium]
MQWIMNVPLSEVLLDAAALSERLNDAARRGRRLTGAGTCGDRLILIWETGGAPGKYRIAPLEAMGDGAVTAAIRARYDAGFITAAIFEAGEKTWGVFCSSISSSNNKCS